MNEIPTKPWFWAISLLLTAVTILGNGLVLYLIFTRNRLHSKTNWFVCSLAVADFCVASVFIPPFLSCELLACNHPNVILYLTSYCSYASVGNIMALTFDRYTAIVLPFQYTSKMTKKRAVCILSIAWLAPLFLDTIPTIFLPIVLDSGEIITQIITMIIFQFLPCVILLIATSRICKVARKHSKRTSVLLRQLRFNQPNFHGKPERSAARWISTIVVVFLICYTAQSFSALCLCFKACMELQPQEPIRYALALLLLINSASNPVVYAFFKRDIKRELYRMIGARRQNESYL